MLKILIWPAFALLIIAQWVIPGTMIWNKEQVLDKGFTHKFEASPVDPEDPFRGRYIILNFKETTFRTKDSLTISNPEKVYVKFAQDARGFSIPSSLTSKKPKDGDYLEVTTSYISREKDSTFVYLNYPFSEYYLEESKAPAAERIYSHRLNNFLSRSYAAVRIWKGDAIIEDVFVNDTSIHQLVKMRMKD